METRYPLYAFTNSKKLRNLFIESRDMDVLIESVSEMSEEEYNGLQFDKLMHELEYIYYQTKNDEYDAVDIQILSTKFEKIETDEFFDSLFMSGKMIIPYIFNKKYVKILKELDYINLYTLYMGLPDFSIPEYALCDYDEDLDMTTPFSRPDELGIHTFLHAYTYKGGVI